jgi:hypothetical protein
MEESTKTTPEAMHKYAIGSISGNDIIDALVGWRVKAILNLKKGHEPRINEHLSAKEVSVHKVAGQSDCENVSGKQGASQIFASPTDFCEQMRVEFDATTDIPSDRIEEGEEGCGDEEGVTKIDGLTRCGGFRSRQD